MRNLLGLVLMLSAAMSAGWQAHDWHNAKLELVASKAADETRQIVVEVTRQSGAALEEKLAELKANEIHTERVIHTETIKPVFNNVCASDDYVRLFNEVATSTERTLSGKSANTLPGKPAETGGANR
ncbi:hypothetical protein [Mixta intestinalis]|jgi:hypothetical protein|uniref:Uncharacterized protein n=1 Tax=Mixta intestinalis TaxID=1615494 RepID=A0A6P1Q1U8_9GAMM|nr:MULTISPECIES: hypothetical protein [Mixta]QHM72956.1 hypothetical protein C7M51_03297 [Mixta intestinalis]QHM77697.1 hypothetical protein C7M52_03700 [Mixta theicola]